MYKNLTLTITVFNLLCTIPRHLGSEKVVQLKKIIVVKFTL